MEQSSQTPQNTTPSVIDGAPPQTTDLARQICERSDEELLAMVAAPADWLPEALEVAKAEIQRRNIPAPPVVPEPLANIPCPPVIPRPPRVREGAMCVQHPQVQATEQCRFCGAFMCPTCDFSFPDDLHVCPLCASKSQDGLSPRRKKLVIWSLVLGAWSTLGMVALFCGAMAGLANTEAENAALGWALLIFVLGPAITGMSLAISARNSRVGNPSSIWIGLAWNAILVGSFVILMIIGLSK